MALQEEEEESAAEGELTTTTMTKMADLGLVVGNYCHDVLIRDGRVIGESLGGATSFISNVFDGLSLPCSYISKVGPDFAYSVSHPPIVSFSSQHTTLFHAHFSTPNHSNHDRVLRRIHACESIHPSDLPPSSPPFHFGLAVGVAGEITPETLARLLNLCSIIFVDVQALIRKFDPIDGTVGLVPLKDSGFYHLIQRIGFLKASAEEAPFVDIEEARRHCCIVVTDGREGCRVYWKDGELQIPSFPADQIDPTGAGDSFLAGFVAGLVWSLAVPDAALLGNFFGSLTVAEIGVPKFNPRMFKKLKNELEGIIQCNSFHKRRDVAANFRISIGHEQLRASLTEAARLQSSDHSLDGHWDLPNSVQVAEHNDCQGNKNQQKLLYGSVHEVIQPPEDHDLVRTIALHNSHQ